MSPTSSAATLPSPSPTALLSELEALYEQGLYLQARTRALAHAPLSAWTATVDERLFAGRLLGQLGNARAGRLHFLAAHTLAPDDLRARFHHASWIADRRGPLQALDLLAAARAGAEGSLPERAEERRAAADLRLLEGMLRAQLRDFETARAQLGAAEALDPGSAWLWAVRARVLALEDRREEGLEAARVSLSVRPHYRAGVQTAADLLVQLGRDDEARALLSDAAERLESAGVVAQLGVLARHQGDVATARSAFLRVLELSPELSRYSFEWLAGELEYVEYLSGDLDRARELAEFPRGKFYARIRERLAGATSVDRRLLDVPWVRQHHVTCAPATLTSIARLWKLPADHLEVAEAICYDGTPAASERRWAEEHGFSVREFTVDWATTIALIDRGVAFTLTTSAPGMGHLQAVAGYDRTRGTLLVRDPSSQGLSEYEHAALFEQQAPFGPRGMAMVPHAERHRLEGLALPDAHAYDALYAVNRALARHDRADAAREVEALEARAPGHRLANDARAILAGYDQNTGAQLACAEAALARHPGDPRLLLWKLSCLRRLGGSHDRAALLAALAHHPRREPLGWLAVVDEHARDARFRPEVEAQLRRILRVRPETARAYQVLGELAWRDEDRPRALELYRLASCVAERDEELAQVYFSSARFAGVPEAGLAHLRARVDRLGGRAAGPALSLAWALEQLDRARDAAEVLKEAISARPEDGELLVGAAESALDRGEDEAAAALLARAEGRVSRAASLRLSARLANRRLDRAAAIAAHRELLEIDPLAIDSHRTVALLLVSDSGDGAALEHLRAAVARFPQCFPLRELLLDYEREHDVARALAEAEQLCALDPGNGWAHRERALLLSRLGRDEEALAAIEAARSIEPGSVYLGSTLGIVHEQAARRAQAREAYRESARRDVDTLAAWPELLRLASTREEERAELDFIVSELSRQRLTTGEAVIRFVDAPEATKEERHTLAARLYAERPDLWSCGVALVRAHRLLERRDEASALAAELCARFPQVPRVWFERGLCAEGRGDSTEAISALREALRLAPAYGQAARQLAKLLEADAATAGEARELLERMVRQSPYDFGSHAELAEHLFARGDREGAVRRMGLALRVDSASARAWEKLRTWTDGHPELRAEAIAGARARADEGSRRAWASYGLALLLDRPEELDACVAALDEAIARDPFFFEAHDWKAFVLAKAKRFDEAAAAAEPAAYSGSMPPGLRARAAWVKAQRGERAEAISAMAEVLAAEPGHRWSLRMISDWTFEEKRFDQAVRWSKAFAEAAPEDPVAHGYLGDALRAKGNRSDEAIAAFRQAVTLDPEYSFATRSLFDLALEQSRQDDAAFALATGGAALPDSARALLEVRLAVARREWTAAKEKFAAMLRLPEPEYADLEAAWKLLLEPVPSADLDAAIDDALADEATSRPAAWLWAQHFFTRRGALWIWSRWRKLGSAAHRDEVAASWLYAAGQARKKALIILFAAFHRARLVRTTRGFGMVGWALNCVDEFPRTVRWFRRWQERGDLAGWMLENAVAAYNATGDLRARDEALTRALELPEDKDRSDLLHWRAFVLAVSGDVRAAEAILAGEPKKDGLMGTIRTLVGLLALGTGDDGRKDRESFRAARTRLDRLWTGERYAYHAALRSLCAQTSAALARQRPGVFTALWRFGYWLQAKLLG